MNVPLLDLQREIEPLRDEMLAAIRDVFTSGRFLHGPQVQDLEAAFVERTGATHAIGCSSGSDALLLSLMALDIGPGDEVIVPSFTFFATASAVHRLGAKIVFADIDPATYNLDPAKAEAAITSRTKAIIPVDLFGQCAALDQFTELATKYSLHIVEDAAQAIGAKYQDRPAGSWGATSCFSFYPTKNLGGCGDGGMITTSDEALAERLRLLGVHGMEPRYYHKVVGIASRIDTIQAAALLVKLQHLDKWTQMRRENAARYDELFREARLDRCLTLPTVDPQAHSVWNQYTIRVPNDRRDRLKGYLADAGIGSEIYYPIPLHRQDCFRELDYALGTLPETERASREVLSLPIFPELTVDEQRTVVSRISEFVSTRRSAA